MTEINGNVRKVLSLPKKGKKNHYIERDVEELESNFNFHLENKKILSQVVNAIKKEQPLNVNELKKTLQELSIVNLKLNQIKEALLLVGVDKEEDRYSDKKFYELNEKIKNQSVMLNSLKIALEKAKSKDGDNPLIKKLSQQTRCKNEYEAELKPYKEAFGKLKELSIEKNIPEVLMIIQKCYFDIDAVREEIRGKAASV